MISSSISRHPGTEYLYTERLNTPLLYIYPVQFLVVIHLLPRRQQMLSHLTQPLACDCCGYLRGLLLLGLESLLAITPDHNDGCKAADDGGSEDEEDDGNADGPDTGEEEGV